MCGAEVKDVESERRGGIPIPWNEREHICIRGPRTQRGLRRERTLPDGAIELEEDSERNTVRWYIGPGGDAMGQGGMVEEECCLLFTLWDMEGEESEGNAKPVEE
eukprot:8562440-Pyramimonas_sp.AAC.1